MHWFRHGPEASSDDTSVCSVQHAYLPVDRLGTLDAALRLATDLARVWPVEQADVAAARAAVAQHLGLSARNLLHLTMCIRYGVTKVLTYDRPLAAAFGG